MRAGVGQIGLARSNVPVIVNGKMRVHSAPGIGAELDEDYLKGHMAAGRFGGGRGARSRSARQGPLVALRLGRASNEPEQRNYAIIVLSHVYEFV